MTTLMMTQPARAMPSFIGDVMQLCEQAQRPQPVLNAVACTTCHSVEDPTSQGGSQTLMATGQFYQSYRWQPNPDTLEQVLNTFCKGGYFNVRYNENDRINNGALPPLWNRPPAEFNYKGSLQVHWLAELGGDNQRLVISRDAAVQQSTLLADTFNLLASPENCWGEKMNFGLIRLTRKANLTIRAEADASQHSSVIPGFAFYRGWDEGQNSQNHDTIVLGDNNPLSTTGLAFMGQALAGKTGEAAEKTFVGLEPGNYELFVTVGTNQSSLGEYALTLTTTSPTSGLNIMKIGSGTVTSAPTGIDCGPVCSAAFAPGNTVTLSAKPQAGYRFSQWDGCPTQTGTTCKLPLNYSMTVTARFEPILHRLIVKTGNTGKVYSLDSKISCGLKSLGLCQATYPEGTRVTLLQQGKQGHWSGACSGQTDRCDLNLAGDLCVAANFAGDTPVSCEQDGVAESTFDLTVSVEGQGRVTTSNNNAIDCGTACAAKLEPGASVTLTATPLPGAVFGGWAGACKGQEPTCTLTASEALAVTATFERLSETQTGAIDGACGTANNSRVTARPLAADALCQAGVSSTPMTRKDGRYTWLCQGIGQAAATSRCYTLSPNGKRNQSPLRLEPAQTTLVSGAQLGLTLKGGSGTGMIYIRQTHQPGVECKMTRKGTHVEVVAGSQPGMCTLLATKGQSSGFNAVEAAPVTITITAPASR